MRFADIWSWRRDYDVLAATAGTDSQAGMERLVPRLAKKRPEGTVGLSDSGQPQLDVLA
jgi:hypothetical protein